jgi:hypothetical protein
MYGYITCLVSFGSVLLSSELLNLSLLRAVLCGTSLMVAGQMIRTREGWELESNGYLGITWVPSLSDL